MATKLFLTKTYSEYNTGNNDAKLNGSTTSAWAAYSLSTTAAGTLAPSNATPTVAGPTSGIEVIDIGTSANMVWYSLPLDADVTISGSITWNIWAAESSNSANVAINGRIEKIDGASGVITLIDATARTTEIALTTRTVNNFSETPAAGVACKRGDRLRVRIYGDDSTTMGAGFTFNIGYREATAGAEGDTWLQLTENLTFVAEPAGTQVFPTDTASAVATTAVDKEAWTSRGGGATSIVTNTVTGFTAPIQATDTGGGTVVDWWTRPLTAFTLGGAVRVNARGFESNASANVSHRCEVAVANGDGTGAVVWATGGGGVSSGTPELGSISEAGRSFLIAGDDVAVTNGQRLRIRFYWDDVIADQAAAGAMASGFTATLYYAGAALASGDTYLIFTQTLTEYVPPPSVVPRGRIPQYIQHLPQ